LVFLFASCHPIKDIFSQNKPNSPIKNPYLVVLGTVQDAGSPQAGCTKDCCKNLFTNPDQSRKVVSLGLIDPVENKKYLFEASPDFVSQLWNLNKLMEYSKSELPDAIFLSHAHIGHYTGLMYLGKESMNSKNVLVYAMPNMTQFLQTNGPWDQLINKVILKFKLCRIRKN
jgi:pyrroloquinoline quinone biosynthesis protein B